MKETRDYSTITDYFTHEPEVTLAVVFGSRARHDTAKNSDTDIGVVFEKKSQNTFYLQGKYGEELAHLLNQKVDVVNLNSADIAFTYRVASEAILVYEKIIGAYADFREDSIKRYFDLKPTYDQYSAELINRIDTGQFGKL